MAAIESAYLTFAEARALIDSAISEATTNGETASVVIVDVGGWVAAAARADDASLDSPEVAPQDGYLCASAKVSSQAQARPVATGARAVPGIPIYRDGCLLGAIGVSGSGAQAAETDGHSVNDVDIATVALSSSAD